MKPKKIIAIIEASKTGFGVYSDALPGITGYGNTIEEAKEDMKTAITEVIDCHIEEGTLPPAYFNNVNAGFVYKYDVASIFNYFGMLDITNFARKIGMNSSLLRQYKTGKTLASDKQKEKIEAGLHALGKELLNVRL